ncbi:MAG: DNA-packaging protein [Firmicutes bacterium]|nr:DNA-packaging protein [Bacillota bacterium]
MAIEQNLLNKVKTSLRISHNVLDDDVTDTIEACLADLKVCGIAKQPDDKLVLNAVKLFCKAAYTCDPGKAAAYQARYDSLKSCLMMAEGYGGFTNGSE